MHSFSWQIWIKQGLQTWACSLAPWELQLNQNQIHAALLTLKEKKMSGLTYHNGLFGQVLCLVQSEKFLNYVTMQKLQIFCRLLLWMLNVNMKEKDFRLTIVFSFAQGVLKEWYILVVHFSKLRPPRKTIWNLISSWTVCHTKISNNQY